MNVFNLSPMNLTREITTVLAKNKNVRIERIISCGQTTGWYDQKETEFVVLLSGNAKIEFENRVITPLSTGDTLLINPHEKHRVVYTSKEPPCVWLCVFY